MPNSLFVRFAASTYPLYLISSKPNTAT